LIDLSGKRVLIVGMGKSGIAAAQFCIHKGADVTITDISEADKVKNDLKQLGELELKSELGYHREKSFLDTDYVILSPGVPHTILPVQKAIENGVEVIGEIELACHFIEEPIIAVTGTNGKTTTTELLGVILRESGKNVFIGGNIGNPLIEYVDQKQKADIVVVEISSFQLDTIKTFHPHIALLLNVTADHLDRYENFKGYTQSKGRIFENQTFSDYAVINADDRAVSTLEPSIKSRKIYFNAASGDFQGGYIKDRCLKIRLNSGKKDEIISIDLSENRLLGKHNHENISAACIAAWISGADPAGIERALKNFSGLKHRIEYVAQINGIRFYDDSKATNLDAVKRALEGFTAPVILIMGGRDKGGDYRILVKVVKKYVKKLVVIGESSELIINAFENHVAVSKAKTMECAVKQAFKSAAAGDVILLSPACSSFDMFKSYAERGQYFVNAVKGLKDDSCS
jgi:UDP-N-acetylmuramoylalanine--D-glutamate ligase